MLLKKKKEKKERRTETVFISNLPTRTNRVRNKKKICRDKKTKKK